MGLAVVHGIVHESGGHILVDTAPGLGATVRIWFPAWFPDTPDADGADSAASSHDATAAPTGLHGRQGYRINVLADTVG